MQIRATPPARPIDLIILTGRPGAGSRDDRHGGQTASGQGHRHRPVLCHVERHTDRPGGRRNRHGTLQCARLGGPANRRLASAGPPGHEKNIETVSDQIWVLAEIARLSLANVQRFIKCLLWLTVGLALFFGVTLFAYLESFRYIPVSLAPLIYYTYPILGSHWSSRSTPFRPQPVRLASARRSGPIRWSGSPWRKHR